MNNMAFDQDTTISITVVDRDDYAHQIEAPCDLNLNLMEILKIYQFPVEGTCGGMALCASCHIYILSEHTLKDRSNDEEDMLDQAFFVEENSRLACQIMIAKPLDHLKIKLAPVQQ